MEFINLFIELFRHADHFIIHIAQAYGVWIYAVLFAIFFSETGIVVCAFLPGDSLLFISGAAAAGGILDPIALIVIITLAACLGNTVNYYIGLWLGKKIYDGSIRWINQDALAKTHYFYEKHGGKTVVLARFVPVVRSFAPLIAGAAQMKASRFEGYSSFGALLWVILVVGLGYLFGNIPFIKDNLGLILIVGVLAALVPFTLSVILQMLKKKDKTDKDEPPVEEAHK